jgi:hypothetical protein
VGYAAWLGDVTRIDSSAQTFLANFVLALRWSDPQLKHSGPGAKSMEIGGIWHPRFLITNAIAEPDRSLPEVADVAPDGTVIYRQRFMGEFSQLLELRAFPFDAATFRIQFVVPGHGSEDIAFVPDENALAVGMEDGVGRADDFTIQDWDVESITSSPGLFRVTPHLEFAGFSVEIAAVRRAQHFVIKVIIPLILIVMMSWAVFWIEPLDASTQMGVAVTAMLTLIAYQFVIDSDVPDLPYLTRLDAFILMSSVLVFLSIVEVLLTTKLANRDRINLARAIDRRCRWIFPIVFFIGGILTLSR